MAKDMERFLRKEFMGNPLNPTTPTPTVSPTPEKMYDRIARILDNPETVDLLRGLPDSDLRELFDEEEIKRIRDLIGKSPKATVVEHVPSKTITLIQDGLKLEDRAEEPEDKLPRANRYPTPREGWDDGEQKDDIPIEDVNKDKPIVIMPPRPDMLNKDKADSAWYDAIKNEQFSRGDHPLVSLNKAANMVNAAYAYMFNKTGVTDALVNSNAIGGAIEGAKKIWHSGQINPIAKIAIIDAFYRVKDAWGKLTPEQRKTIGMSANVLTTLSPLIGAGKGAVLAAKEAGIAGKASVKDQLAKAFEADLNKNIPALAVLDVEKLSASGLVKGDIPKELKQIQDQAAKFNDKKISEKLSDLYQIDRGYESSRIHTNSKLELSRLLTTPIKIEGAVKHLQDIPIDPNFFFPRIESAISKVLVVANKPSFDVGETILKFKNGISKNSGKMTIKDVTVLREKLYNRALEAAQDPTMSVETVRAFAEAIDVVDTAFVLELMPYTKVKDLRLLSRLINLNDTQLSEGAHSAAHLNSIVNSRRSQGAVKLVDDSLEDNAIDNFKSVFEQRASVKEMLRSFIELEVMRLSGEMDYAIHIPKNTMEKLLELALPKIGSKLSANPSKSIASRLKSAKDIEDLLYTGTNLPPHVMKELAKRLIKE